MHQGAVNLSKFDGNLVSSSTPKNQLKQPNEIERKPTEIANEIVIKIYRSNASETGGTIINEKL